MFVNPISLFDLIFGKYNKQHLANRKHYFDSTPPPYMQLASELVKGWSHYMKQMIPAIQHSKMNYLPYYSNMHTLTEIANTIEHICQMLITIIIIIKKGMFL